jgi:hypothetical protein
LTIARVGCCRTHVKQRLRGSEHPGMPSGSRANETNTGVSAPKPLKSSFMAGRVTAPAAKSPSPSTSAPRGHAVCRRSPLLYDREGRSDVVGPTSSSGSAGPSMQDLRTSKENAGPCIWNPRGFYETRVRGVRTRVCRVSYIHLTLRRWMRWRAHTAATRLPKWSRIRGWVMQELSLSPAHREPCVCVYVSEN